MLCKNMFGTTRTTLETVVNYYLILCLTLLSNNALDRTVKRMKTENGSAAQALPFSAPSKSTRVSGCKQRLGGKKCSQGPPLWLAHITEFLTIQCESPL